MKKLLIKLSLFLLALTFLILPKFVEAALLAQQTTNSASVTYSANSGTSYQTLGTGLVGNIEKVSVTVSGSGFTSFQWSPYFLVCNNTYTVSQCVHSSQGPNMSAFYALNGTYLSTTKTTYTFNYSPFAVTGKLVVLGFQGAGNGQSLTVYGSATDNYPAGSCYNSGSFAACSNIADVYFAVENSTIPNLGFTSPPEATSFPLNYEIPFDGDCPENGANKIRFVNPPYVASEGYEIDCIGNEFSFSLPARDYGNFYLELFSQSYDEGTPQGQAKYHAGIHYTVDPEYNEWIMNLNYPRCGQNDCIHFTLNPSTNFPLRWAYKIPPSANKSQITYRFREYTDQTFQTLKSGGVSFSDNLAHLLTTSDKPELEFHHNNMVVTNGVTQYYKAELIYNNVVKVFHLFVVTGDNSNNGQVPTLPSIVLGGCSNNQIMAALCDVFIPGSEFFTNKFNYLNQLLITKAPFSYFMALKDKFANVSTTTTDGYFINATLATAGTNPISVNFQAFNTADSNISGMLNNFKPYMIALLWLGFASYALTRVYRLFKPI
jgi:hypothetical protein